MKKPIKILSVLVLTILFFASCKGSGQSNGLEGTFKGYISYKEGVADISNNDGTVKVIKTGNLYSFDFSDDIPDLTGIKMETKDNILINTDVNGNGVVKIVDAQRKLIIHYRKNGAKWDAEGVK